MAAGRGTGCGRVRGNRLPTESFDFLGYTVGRFYGKGGVPYIGTHPSRKAVHRLLQRIHEATTSRWHSTSPAERVAVINRLLRSWTAYFNQGLSLPRWRGRGRKVGHAAPAICS